MDCWDILGLAPDADVRAIKRAYAAKLKQSRPEDDPEAFSELRSAYEQALEKKQLAQANVDSVVEDDAAQTHGKTLPIGVADSEIEAMVSSLIVRLKDTHHTTQTLAWLSNQDLFVDLNRRPMLGQALFQRLQSKQFADLPALVGLGALFGWLDHSDEAEIISLDFFYRPSAFETLIANIWMDSKGARITGSFFELAAHDLEQAAQALEAEIVQLDEPFKPLVAWCFLQSISEPSAPRSGGKEVDARTILTIANFFGWQDTERSPLAVRRARLHYEISCLPTNLSKRSFSPRQRALWRLRYKKGSWRDIFTPTIEHYHLACIVEECQRVGLDPQDFANLGQLKLAKSYDPQQKARSRRTLALLGLLPFSVFALAICVFVVSRAPIAGIPLTIGAIQLLIGMCRDYSSIEKPPSVR